MSPNVLDLDKYDQKMFPPAFGCAQQPKACQNTQHMLDREYKTGSF